MSDRPKFTPYAFPESWERQPAFRQVFLVHLPPQHSEACEQLGEFVFTALLEAHMSDAEPSDVLRGVAADLHVCALVLETLIEGYDELKLLDRVAGLNDRVRAVADELRDLTVPETA